MNKKVLYISYNGMTDPLGQSQVLPYVTNLSKQGFDITLLSVEKKEKLAKEGEAIKKIMDTFGINWEILIYHNKIPFISKIYDRSILKRKTISLYKKERFDLIHCRSHIAAELGLLLKTKFNVPYIFDMRAFWPDEKKESNHWPISNPFYRQVYAFYKRMERRFLETSDAIVVLTNSAKKEICSWGIYPDIEKKVTVIPCCADVQHFSVDNINIELRSKLVDKYQLMNASPVVCYLGSIGEVYGINEMLMFFDELKKTNLNARFLFFSKEPADLVLKKISVFENIKPSDIAVIYVKREEIPTHLSLCSFTIFFYKPTFSRIACSPTKFAELASFGLPVVCNSVGDLNKDFLSGLPIEVVENLDEKTIRTSVKKITSLVNQNNDLQKFAEREFDLKNGVEKYNRIYNLLTKK